MQHDAHMDTWTDHFMTIGLQRARAAEVEHNTREMLYLANARLDGYPPVPPASVLTQILD
jgi:hypothetical protein